MQGVGPGSLLGSRYAVQQRLSQTSSWERWSASDTALERDVVLLCFPRHNQQADAALDAARRAAGVEEFRLTRVLDVGVDADLVFVVEEPMTGAATLTALLSEGGLPPDEVRRIVGEAAGGLAAAAARGLHHGVLTPRDVLVQPDGAVKVRGLATQAALLGEDDRPMDQASRADAVALAGLLYAGLTGRWPLPGPDSGLEAAPRVVSGVAAPSEIAAGVPGDIDVLVTGALTADGGPRTPGEVVEQLYPGSTGPRRAGLVPGSIAASRVSGARTNPLPRDPATGGVSRGTPPAVGRHSGRRAGAGSGTGIGAGTGTGTGTGQRGGGLARWRARAGATRRGGRLWGPGGSGSSSGGAAPLAVEAHGVAETGGVPGIPDDGTAGGAAGLLPPAVVAATSAAGTAIAGATGSAARTVGKGVRSVAGAVGSTASTVADQVGKAARTTADRAAERSASKAERQRFESLPDDLFETEEASLSDVLVETDEDLEPSVPVRLAPDAPATANRPESKLALAIVAAFVVLAAVVGFWGLPQFGGVPTSTSSSSARATSGATGPATGASGSPTAPAGGALAPVAIVGSAGFEPTNGGQVPSNSASRAYDGDPESGWTSKWFTTEKFGGLPIQGIGLIVDLGQPTDVRRVTLNLPAEQDATVYVASQASLDGAKALGSFTGKKDEVVLDTPSGAPMAGELVIVFVTRLGPDGEGKFRARVSEIQVSK